MDGREGTISYDNGDGTVDVKFADGSKSEYVNSNKIQGDMTGIQAIANALSVSSSMNKLNVLSNFIGTEGGQALVDAAPPQLQTFCGFDEGQTEANLSNKRLGPGDAVLLAWELTNGYVSSSMNTLK